MVGAIPFAITPYELIRGMQGEGSAFGPRSRFEAVLAVPLQEMSVGLIGCAGRGQNAPGLVDDGAHAGCVVDLPRDQDLMIVRDADQAAVKHPMRSPREGNSVADDVRPIGLNRSYVRGF